MDEALKRKIKKYWKMFSNPVLIIDKDFTCVYSNTSRPCKAGVCIDKFFHRTIELSNDKIVEAMMTVEGVSYFARISPFIEGLFVCELFTTNYIMTMADCTDVVDAIIPKLISAEHYASVVWKKFGELQFKFHMDEQIGYSERLVSLEKDFLGVSSFIKNLSECSNLFLCEQNHEEIDVRNLVSGIVSRANKILNSVGRQIEFVDPYDMFSISASKRHAINALAHGIQNAMMYSPKDSVPVAVIYREKENNKRYVVIQIVNDSILIVDKDNEEDIQHELKYNRSGFGFRIIKRFAENAGGKFTYIIKDNQFRLCVKIPEMLDGKNYELGFECSDDNEFKSDTPDLLDVLMGELKIFYQEN